MAVLVVSAGGAYLCPSLATAGTMTTIDSPGITVSPVSGPPGTVVSIVVQDCNQPVVTFTSKTDRLSVPGSVNGEDTEPAVPQGNFAATFAIPASATGSSSFTASCSAAVEGYPYGGAFTVTGSGASPDILPAGATLLADGVASTPDGGGYWISTSDGGVFTYGSANFYGSAYSLTLAKPIVGLAPTPDGAGYWLVGSDGGVFAYGDATYYGGEAGKQLAGPVVGIASTADGKGYWLTGSDGGIYNFGDAKLESNCYAYKGGCGTPITGIAGSASTGDDGYWLVGQNGGVFNFGSAPNEGSQYNKMGTPAVAITRTKDGKGFWLTGKNGGVFNNGDAVYSGSGYGDDSNPFTSLAADFATGGYWVLDADGGIFSFNATFHGSAYGAFQYGGPAGGGGLPTCYNKNAYCWGMDSAATQSSISTIDSAFGSKPDFMGRYLTSGGGPTALTSTEASFYKTNNLPLLLIADLTGGCTGTTDASNELSAVTTAASSTQLNIPANGQIAVLLDLEPGVTVTSACLTAYADGIAQKGFRPGFYLNPGSGSGDAGTAYCTGVGSDPNMQNALLWSAVPETGDTGPSTAPTPFAPELPPCSSGVSGVWQYGEQGQTGPPYDTDELSPTAANASALWLP